MTNGGATAPPFTYGLDLSELAPFRVDALDLLVGSADRIGSAHLARGDLREHLRDQELAEHLRERGVRVARIPRIDGVLLRDRREDLVLAAGLMRVRRRKLLDPLEGKSSRERREVVELRRDERVLVVDFEVGHELLGRRDVLGELPD